MSSNAGTVLVTGCSAGGIGHALAIGFKSRGLRVFAASRSLAKMEALADQGIELIQLDVTKPDSIRDAKNTITERTGGTLDYLVNNAGISIEGPAIEADISSIKDMFDVNVFAPMEIVKQFIPLLVRSRGTIVNISSVLSIMPYPMMAAYNASKAAITQYSETLRLELEPVKVKVVTVVTGQVRTNIVSNPTLDDASIYKPIESTLQGRAKNHLEKTMDPSVYAQGVVNHVLKSAPSPWFWKGTNSTITWLVSTFAYKTAFDPLMKQLAGLRKFREEIFQRATSLKT